MKTRKQFDLRTVDPRGRLDVLAAQAVDKFAEAVPELRPIVDENREEIHASINEKLGPHALGVDVPKLIEHARPFFPLLSVIAGQVIANYNAGASVPKEPPKPPKGEAA